MRKSAVRKSAFTAVLALALGYGLHLAWQRTRAEPPPRAAVALSRSIEFRLVWTTLTNLPRDVSFRDWWAAKGRIRVGNVEAKPRDGVAVTGLETITVTALEDAELVLVDAA